MRKKLLIIFVSLMALLVFTGCKKEENKTLHIYNWTYYIPDSLVAKFEQETGYKVVIDNYSSNEEMFAKISAGGGKGFDLIFPSADYTQIMINLNMLQKIDKTQLPNIEYLTTLAIKSAKTYDENLEYSVPYFVGAAGVAVNTTLAPSNYERSWAIFEDARFKGKITLLDDMREVMGDALITLGYSTNSKNPEEIKQAAEKVEKLWKPNIIKFDAESYAKGFASGDIVVAHCYPENIIGELSEDKRKEVDFFLPQEGGCMYIDNMVIPKESKNAELAHKFINFILDPENHAAFLDEFLLPPTTNTEAVNYMETTPIYTAEDLENYTVNIDIGEDLAIYNGLWHSIRYDD